MKIYTKTGDKGMTRLVDGSECSKASTRVEAYGAVDELNSVLGLSLAALTSTTSLPHDAAELAAILEQELTSIQNQLFTVGSHLACEKEETRKHLPAFSEAWIMQLEKAIDAMTEKLPELKNFILPGGTTVSAYLHLARTICRRSERWVVRAREEGDKAAETERALIYLNRLSDYLFTAARFANEIQGEPSVIWVKP